MSTDQQIMNDFAELLKENMALKERVRELEAGQQSQPPAQPEVNPNDDPWTANMRLKSKTALINIIRSERRGSSAPSVLLGEPVAWMTKDGRISTLDTMDGKQTAKSGPAYFGDHWCIPLYANTKAVSIDRIMEVVKEWVKSDCVRNNVDDENEFYWSFDDLRERLSKLNTTST